MWISTSTPSGSVTRTFGAGPPSSWLAIPSGRSRSARWSSGSWVSKLTSTSSGGATGLSCGRTVRSACVAPGGCRPMTPRAGDWPSSGVKCSLALVRGVKPSRPKNAVSAAKSVGVADGQQVQVVRRCVVLAVAVQIALHLVDPDAVTVRVADAEVLAVRLVPAHRLRCPSSVSRRPRRRGRLTSRESSTSRPARRSARAGLCSMTSPSPATRVTKPSVGVLMRRDRPSVS